MLSMSCCQQMQAVNQHVMLHAAGGWGSIQTNDADIARRQATPWSLQDGLSQHPLHETAAHACDQSGIMASCDNVTPVGLV